MMPRFVVVALAGSIALAALIGCGAPRPSADAPRPSVDAQPRPAGSAIQLWLDGNQRAGYPEPRLDAELRTAGVARRFLDADLTPPPGGARTSGVVSLPAAGAAELGLTLRAPSGDTLAVGSLPVRLAAGCVTAVRVTVRTAAQAAGLPGPEPALRVPLRGSGADGAAMYVSVALAALGTPGEPCTR